MNPGDLPLRHAITYAEHMDDLLEREQKIQTQAVAEPLFDALEAVFG